MANSTNNVAAVGSLTGAGTGVVNFLTTPSSANLATALTTKTGTGLAVFGTSPTFTTSVTTGSTSFDVFNTAATTVNAFGDASTINCGANGSVINLSSNTTIDYRRVVMGGGNSYGYLFTSFPGLGDGIHLGYNAYYNAAGTAVYPVNYTSSILSVGYSAVTIRIATSNSGTPQTVTQFGTSVLQNLFPNSSTWGGLALSRTFTQDSGGGSGLGQQHAIFGVPTLSPTASTGVSAGMTMSPTVNAASTKTITRAYGGSFGLTVNSAAGATGTITDAWTVSISGPTKTNGTVPNGYGLVVTKGSGCTNNYAAYFDAQSACNATPTSSAFTIGGTNPLRLTAVTTGTGTTAIIDSNGDLLKLTSSKRFKKNITPSTIDSSFIYKLEPVEYDYKSSDQHDFGLIAEDVEKLCPLLINYDNDNRPESIKYDRISVLLVAEISKLKAELEILKNR